MGLILKENMFIILFAFGENVPQVMLKYFVHDLQPMDSTNLSTSPHSSGDSCEWLRTCSDCVRTTSGFGAPLAMPKGGEWLNVTRS